MTTPTGENEKQQEKEQPTKHGKSYVN